MLNRRNLPALAVFAAVLLLSVSLLGWIASAGNEEQAQLVKDAVRRAALTCYAVEGAYPSDLDYLKENYALAYNEEQYLVVYDAFASNLTPEILVVERGGEP